MYQLRVEFSLPLFICRSEGQGHKTILSDILKSFMYEIVNYHTKLYANLIESTNAG